MRRVARVCQRLLEPIDIAWLVAFRVLWGSLMAWSLWRFQANGWVDTLFVEPRFQFKYWGFAWVEPLPGPALHALFQALTGLGLCVAAGLTFRLTAPLLALGFSYVQLIDVTNYLNHYYLAVLVCWLLALSPAARSGSVDAWLGRRMRGRGRAAPPQTVAAAWHVLLRVQVGVVYLYAGLAKAQSDWLLHGQPLRIWLGDDTKLPVIGQLFLIDEVPLLMSWAGFLFDTTIVGWLLWPRTRPYAYALVILFHSLTQALFNIGMFPSIMVCSALVFFSPSWPRRVLAALGRVPRGVLPRRALWAPPPADLAPTSAATRVGAAHKLALGALAAYCLVQLLLPLRHLAYQGNVLWHEQGMRFSWRVMVRVKGGGTTFVVTQRESGRVWHIHPREYLTPRQEAEMSSQPDLIVQLAQHIERDMEARGLGPVEVRAESHVTLNGRRSARLIDDSVDLARVRDGLAPSAWVLPAPASAPPHTRPVL